MNIIKQQQNDIAYFMLPGFCEHYLLYQKMNNFFVEYPQAKKDNVNIYCYYGNIPFCTWDGGRIFNQYQPLTIEQMKEVQNYYNNILQSKIRFVFTNNLLIDQHLHERYNNLALQIFNKEGNEVVLNSSLLENYLKENYPNYVLIASTTKCSNRENSKIDLDNDIYKFTCLDYNLNHNWNFLDSLNELQKNKTEFLVNPICGPGCPQRKEHYRLNSLFSLTYGQQYAMKHCEIKHNSSCAAFNSAHISPDEIFKTYIPKGFHYFKLEGRTWQSTDMAFTLADYLVKPEYQMFFLKSVID